MRRKSFLVLLLALSLGTVAVPAGNLVAITLKQAFGILMGAQWTKAQQAIVWQLRLPHVLGAQIANLFASYVHLHFLARPELALRMVMASNKIHTEKDCNERPSDRND